MHTQAVEDYLKTIFDLQEEHGKVTTNFLAVRLQVSPASVTGMVKKLCEMKLVSHEPYKGVGLTPAGKKVALEVLRHHRLVELYLAEALDVPWDQVHAEAEKWEHVVSKEVAERMDKFLGYPTVDPHGQPIPTKDGKIASPEKISLSQLKEGEGGFISEVNDKNSEFLKYIGEMGLYPKVEVEVLKISPFGGPIILKVGEEEYSLGKEVAEQIFVSEINTGPTL